MRHAIGAAPPSARGRTRSSTAMGAGPWRLDRGPVVDRLHELVADPALDPAGKAQPVRAGGADAGVAAARSRGRRDVCGAAVRDRGRPASGRCRCARPTAPAAHAVRAHRAGADLPGGRLDDDGGAAGLDQPGAALHPRRRPRRGGRGDHHAAGAAPVAAARPGSTPRCATRRTWCCAGRWPTPRALAPDARPGRVPAGGAGDVPHAGHPAGGRPATAS